MVPYAVYSYYIYTDQLSWKRTTLKILFIILYPLWVVIGAVSYVLAMMFYPCLRSPSNHGLYDFFYNIYDLTI